MPRVQLRDILTEADRAAALGVRRGPGQDRFVESVEQSFVDAVTYAHACPRYWTINEGEDVVGFAMISDGIPEDRLAADSELIGPYFLWRLIIDEGRQRLGYGTATLDAIAAYVRGRPGGDALFTSAAQGEGTPQPFYERYGFVPTGQVVEGEVVLRLDLTGQQRDLDHGRPGADERPGMATLRP